MDSKILKTVLDVPKGTWYFVRKADKAIGQARTMKKKFRFDCRLEDVIAVMDCTIFGSGKDGYLLTEKGMYNARDKKHPFVAFSDIEKAEVQDKNYVKIFFKNGEILNWWCLSSSSYIAEVLNQIIYELKPDLDKRCDDTEEEEEEIFDPMPDFDEWCEQYDREEKDRKEAGEKSQEEREQNSKEVLEYMESIFPSKSIQQLKEEGLEALENSDYENARICFKKSNENLLFAIATYNDSQATLEQLMEAEVMACKEAAYTNDAKVTEVLEKLRRRLASVLINREEERTIDYAGVDLPTRYLALRYALMQNDRETIVAAAYNLAIFYFKRDDNAYMCGVDEAAALCHMAQKQERLMGKSEYSRVNDVLRDCKNAIKGDYVNPPSAGEFDERIARLDKLADDQPFAAYGRARYYCDCGKKKENLWRAEKLAVYAVSAEYKPLQECYYSPSAYEVVFVDVEQQSPEELLQEIRDKLKAKGLPSKYDMTDRWKEHHAFLTNMKKVEKNNQKSNYEAAMDAYLFAGEDMEKLKKAKAMAEALRRTDVKDSSQDRSSNILLKKIEAKITYVTGKQYLEAGNCFMARSELKKLTGDDRTKEAMDCLAIAYLCGDDMADEDYVYDTKSAIDKCGNEELKGLLEVLELYAEGRSFHIRKNIRAEYRYHDAIERMKDTSPYPHPFYWYAKYWFEKSYSVFDLKYDEEKLQKAYNYCQKGMEMVDNTTWLTKSARKSLHSSFEYLLDDIRSSYRIMKSSK